MSLKYATICICALLLLALSAYAQVNHVPMLNPIGGKQINEGKLLEFNISATDEDNDTLVFDTNASFGALDKSTGLFSWTPSFDDDNLYFVLFNVTDGKNTSSFEIIRVTITDAPPPVNSTNHAPVLNLIGGKQVDEGALLEFNVTASDQDNDPLTFGTNSSFGSLDPSTGLFSWTPGYNYSGLYFLRFEVTDEIDPAFEIIQVNVTDKEPLVNTSNHAPVLILIGGKQVLEGEPLHFIINATDEDNDTLTFGANSTFGFLNETTGEFTWKPGFTDANFYFVLFNVTDGISTNHEIIRLNITEAGNQNPKIFVVEPRGIDVNGTNSTILWNATDDDNDSLSFTAYITKRIYDLNDILIGENRTEACNTTQNQCSFDTKLFPNGIYVAIVVANDSLNFTDGYSNDFLINNTYTNLNGNQQAGQDTAPLSHGNTHFYFQEAGQSLLQFEDTTSGKSVPNATTQNITLIHENNQNITEPNNEAGNNYQGPKDGISGAVVSQAANKNILLAIITLAVVAGLYAFYKFNVKNWKF